MIELGLSSVPPATEVRSGENSYTDLVLAGLLAQQGRGAEAAEWATGAGAICGGAMGALFVCRHVRPRGRDA